MTEKPKAKFKSKFNKQSIAQRYELDPIDLEILKYRVKDKHISIRELARVVEVTTLTIQRHLEKPAYKSAYEELTASTDTLLKKAAREAAIRLIDLIKKGDKDVALKACRVALAPYINQHTVTAPPSVKFVTTVTPDGNLVQEVMTMELSPGEEAGVIADGNEQDLANQESEKESVIDAEFSQDSDA